MKKFIFTLVITIGIIAMTACGAKDAAETTSDKKVETIEIGGGNDTAKTEEEEEIENSYDPANRKDFTGVYESDSTKIKLFMNDDLSYNVYFTDTKKSLDLVGLGNWVDGGVEIALINAEQKQAYAVFFEEDGKYVFRITQSDIDGVEEQTDYKDIEFKGTNFEE